MNLLPAALLFLSALPVTTPEEWGRLTVDSAEEVSGGFRFTVTYENDTGLFLDKVRLECTTIDHRGSVVNTNSAELTRVGLGEVRQATLEVGDATHRSARAECRIAQAQHTEP